MSVGKSVWGTSGGTKRANLLEKFPFLLGIETSLSHKQGETIIREGDVGDKAFIIKSGFVEIKVGDQLLDVLEPGEILGEMAVLDEANRSATAIAATECELIVIDPPQFESFAATHPEFFHLIMHIVMDRLRRTNKLAEAIMAASLSAIQTAGRGDRELRHVVRALAEAGTRFSRPPDALRDRPIDGREGDGTPGRLARMAGTGERGAAPDLAEAKRAAEPKTGNSPEAKSGDDGASRSGARQEQTVRNGTKPKSEVKW